VIDQWPGRVYCTRRRELIHNLAQVCKSRAGRSGDGSETRSLSSAFNILSTQDSVPVLTQARYPGKSAPIVVPGAGL
jgi:hypothetical protein